VSFDGCGGVTEVDGPDGTRTMPMEDVDEEFVVPEVDAAEAAQEIGEFLAGHGGAEALGGGEAARGAGGGGGGGGIVAEQAWGAALGPTGGLWVQAVAAPSQFPGGQCPWGQAEQRGCLAEGAVAARGPAVEGDSRLTDGAFGGAGRLLPGQAAVKRPGA